jgi:transketolase
MGLEDISLMRSLPTMGVFQPMDARETELIMDYLVKEWKGPAYLRLTRQNLPDLYPANAPFKPGKLMQIHAPSDANGIHVTCIATGAGVAEAVQAAEKLKAGGIHLSVWNAHSLKPFDEQTTLEIAKKAHLMITVEDHSVIGGLGSCVAEALAKATQHPRLVKFGIQDTFGESGEGPELFDKFGLSAEAIARQVTQEVRSMR